MKDAAEPAARSESGGLSKETAVSVAPTGLISSLLESWDAAGLVFFRVSFGMVLLWHAVAF